MAKITEVTYERLSRERVRQYENERVCATATVDKGENPAIVLQALKRFVDQQLGLGPTEEELNEARKLIAQYDEQSFSFS